MPKLQPILDSAVKLYRNVANEMPFGGKSEYTFSVDEQGGVKRSRLELTLVDLRFQKKLTITFEEPDRG